MGFRMVGTRPTFEAYLKKRKDAIQCREEFEELVRYLRHDTREVHFDEAEEAIRHVTQIDIQEIYDGICREVSEFKVEPTEGEENEHASENRIIAAEHVIYLWGGDSSEDTEMTMEVVIGAVATLLCANKLGAELLETGWVRADMPNVRVAYLLAYYLLYGDKAAIKYQQLGEYVDLFVNSEERKAEIQQVQAFIDSRNNEPIRI